MNRVVLVELLFMKLNNKVMLGFQENQSSIHVQCPWPAESINKWVEGRGGLSALSGPICEIVKLIWSRKFNNCQEKSWNLSNFWLSRPCLNTTLILQKKNLNRSKKVIAFSVNSVRTKTLNG